MSKVYSESEIVLAARDILGLRHFPQHRLIVPSSWSEVKIPYPNDRQSVIPYQIDVVTMTTYKNATPDGGYIRFGYSKKADTLIIASHD